MTETEAVHQAFAAVQRREWPDAERLCREVLTANPASLNALYLLGVIAIETRRMQLALQVLSRAATIAPDNAEIQNNRGLALAALGRHEEALADYEQAISLKPDFADAYNNRGNALSDLGDHSAGLASYERAISLGPTALIFYNRGNVLRKLGRYADAVVDYDESLTLSPDYAQALFGRGNALRDLQRNADAIASYERAIALAPDFAEVYNNLGNALRDLRQHAAAVRNFERAISLKPDLADAYNNLGLTLQEMGQDAEAIAMFDRALALKPDPGTHVNRGNALRDRGLLGQALESYGRALQLEPNRDFLYGIWLHTKLKLCDWEGLESQLATLTERIDRGDKVSLPFSVLGMTDAPATQKKAAEIWVHHQYPASSVPENFPKSPAHDKIRVGYFSADFHEHATSRLMVELFERHDKARFRLTAFSFGPDNNDAMRARVAAAFDEFIDVSGMTDHEVVQLARQREIDIAVDLKGFTQGNRARIFSLRAAPLQVNYLAYPGTMGADFIDYLIADRTLIPPGAEQHYAEKIIYLPHSYQMNDRQRPIAAREFQREEVGLPPDGFVFCCFNSNYKILPETFDSWMRILGQVSGSVLWLLREDALAEQNLKNAASGRGIDANRLVFAQTLPLPEHLARHRLADLFLDTNPCNAHTTASDALWAGLPIVSRAGESFAARVAASLLNAIGLQDLVVDSTEAYVQLAVDLALDPDRLGKLRKLLAGNRLKTALFDSRLATRHIEEAYAAIYSRWRSGGDSEHTYLRGANDGDPEHSNLRGDELVR